MNEEVLEEVAEDVKSVDLECVIDEPIAEVEKPFEWSDLAITCSCGATTIVEVNNPANRAIQFVLAPVEGKRLNLQCPACKHSLSLAYQEASNPPVEVEATVTTEPNQDEQVQEESKTEE